MGGGYESGVVLLIASYAVLTIAFLRGGSVVLIFCGLALAAAACDLLARKTKSKGEEDRS
jgi:hypothetical protein